MSGDIPRVAAVTRAIRGHAPGGMLIIINRVSKGDSNWLTG